MKLTFQKIFVIFLFLPLVSAKTIPVGVSPSVVDLGNVDRGSDQLAKFYIVSPSEDTILVHLEKYKGTFEFFSRGKYVDFAQNYSEEDVLSWLKFITNPVELRISDDPEMIKGGLKTYRDVNLILTIPQNAEPGYHLLSVVPSPVISEVSEGQIGTQMVAVTPVRIVFNVPGDAIREGKILDITQRNVNPNTISIDVHFLNTGTVTISARATSQIIDNQGNIVNTITSPIQPVKPNEKVILSSYLPIDDFKEGIYDINSEVDYTTGSSRSSSTIKIEQKQMEKVTGEAYKQFEFKWWMLIILILLVYIIYRVLKR